MSNRTVAGLLAAIHLIVAPIAAYAAEKILYPAQSRDQIASRGQTIVVARVSGNPLDALPILVVDDDPTSRRILEENIWARQRWLWSAARRTASPWPSST